MVFNFNEWRFWMTPRLQALFPLSRPVADATVEYCEQRTDDPALREKFALRLGQVRIRHPAETCIRRTIMGAVDNQRVDR